MNDIDNGAADTPAPRRRMRARGIILGIVAGAALALVAVLVFTLATRNRAPRLTQEAYEQAAERWDAKGPANYNLDLEITGNRTGQIHVEVRDGLPVRMTRDGVQPRQERTWFVWTVPGQFDTIAQELEMARDPAASFDSPQASQVVQWAEFDSEYGYPLRYDRVVMGAPFETHWRTVKFEPLPDTAGNE